MEGTGVEWRGGQGRAGQGRVPDCLGGLSRVGISSRSTRPWNGQPPSSLLYTASYCISILHTGSFGLKPLCPCDNCCIVFYGPAALLRGLK